MIIYRGFLINQIVQNNITKKEDILMKTGTPVMNHGILKSQGFSPQFAATGQLKFKIDELELKIAAIGNDISKINQNLNNSLGREPSFIPNFASLLDYMFEGLSSINCKIHSGSKIKKLFESVLQGENGNTGLKAAIHKFNSLRDMEIEPDTCSKKEFYEKYLKKNFLPVFKTFIRIESYRRIIFQGLRVADHFRIDGVNVEHFDEICGYAKAILKETFDIQIKPLRLFRDLFDDTKHESFGRSTLIALKPEYKAKQQELKKNVIYDIHSIGITSKELDLNSKSIVIYKP